MKTQTKENKFKYKKDRNKLNHLIRIRSKKRYYKKKFEQTQNNIKETWKIINKNGEKKKLPDTFNHDKNLRKK